MNKWSSLHGPVSEEEEKALNMLVEHHEEKLKKRLCFFCETEEATTKKFSEPACEKCEAEKFITIEDPTKARKRTDKQNALRVKMFRQAFEHAFNECWYCEDRQATTTKFGQKICSHCDSQEIRTMAPLHEMTEQEKAEHLRVGIRLFI